MWEDGTQFITLSEHRRRRRRRRWRGRSRRRGDAMEILILILILCPTIHLFSDDVVCCVAGFELGCASSFVDARVFFFVVHWMMTRADKPFMDELPLTNQSSLYYLVLPPVTTLPSPRCLHMECGNELKQE